MKRLESEGEGKGDWIRRGLLEANRQLLRLAVTLQKKTEGYSAEKKRRGLLLFVAVFSMASLLVMVRAVHVHYPSSLDITRIKPLPLIEDSTKSLPITPADVSRVQQFKQYLDSLETTAEGRRYGDSLLLGRPHLMDSVHLLINLFLEQEKTKANENRTNNQ